MRLFQRILITFFIIAQPLWPAVGSAGSPDNYEGRLQIMRADNFATGESTTTIYLNTRSDDNSRLTLTLDLPKGLPAFALRTGDSVTVQGLRSGNTLQVQSLQPLYAPITEDPTGLAQTASITAAAIEDRKAVVIIVDMLDAVNSLSVNDVAGYMYSDGQNVDGVFEASSFQQLGFDPDTDGDTDPDVFGPYTINYNASAGCSYSAWASAADAAAQADGVDLSLYQHKIYMLPSAANCGWAGLGSVGCSPSFCHVWVRSGGGPVIAHELGHNLGWIHASSDPENDGIINSEYGDRSGIMGYPYWSQAIAPHRDQRLWFDAFPGTLQTSPNGGTYELYALELDPGVAVVGTQVVKIPIAGTSQYYYLSYRRQIGSYPVYATHADKINVHRYAGTGYNSLHITNLVQNETFTAVSNDVEITVNATDTGNATAWVNVSMNNLPTAAYSHSINGLSVQFTEACSDSDGTIQSYSWNFGDGNSSTLPNPSHTYADAVNYTASLTVVDDQGGSKTVSNAVNLGPSPSTANAGSGGGGGSSGGCFIDTLLH